MKDKIIAIGIGGFLGAASRYLISCVNLNVGFMFPLDILIANMLGCFILAFVVGYTIDKLIKNDNIVLGIKTGFCGALTTFSTFTKGIVVLIENGQPFLSIVYIVLSIVLGIIMICIGYKFGSIFSKKEISEVENNVNRENKEMD